ncbi:MAG: DUF4426 domain-containing protein [Gammaproteobacteria bacterium]|nr:MAG: DUF4426 domain-containing protein [Gammaproteobacteria bacterium]TDJ37791.1 MAG: DUF4426 domain-containing protein [Gammaproteobacteria bacterium]
MIFDAAKGGTVVVIALLFASACSESGRRVECGSHAGPGAAKLTALDYEVDYNAYSSTFLQPEVAKIYGIDRHKKVGVVMVSVYLKDTPGMGVEACVSGGAMNSIGQMIVLNFDEIREGEAIYHIGTFRIGQEEDLTFRLDVEIATTGKTHALEWRQKFRRG